MDNQIIAKSQSSKLMPQKRAKPFLMNKKSHYKSCMLNSDNFMLQSTSPSSSPPLPTHRYSNYYSYGDFGKYGNDKSDDYRLFTGDNRHHYPSSDHARQETDYHNKLNDKVCFLNSPESKNHKKKKSFFSSTRKLFNNSSSRNGTIFSKSLNRSLAL
jgi:hypothetical protein